jgi:hypothetical protein
MAVWQKGSGLYFVARFMKGVHGLTRLKLGSKAQGEQGYLKTSQLFWASGTGGTSCQKSPSRASALLFCVVCDVCPCVAKNRDQVKISSLCRLMSGEDEYEKFCGDIFILRFLVR